MIFLQFRTYPYTNEITATFQIYNSHLIDQINQHISQKLHIFKQTIHQSYPNTGESRIPFKILSFQKISQSNTFPPFPIQPFLPTIVQSSSRSRSPKIDFPKPAARFQSALVHSIYIQCKNQRIKLTR